MDKFVPMGIKYVINPSIYMDQFELEILKHMYILKKLFPTGYNDKDKEEIALLRERITHLKAQLTPSTA